jgi:hypothetical protein
VQVSGPRASGEKVTVIVSPAGTAASPLAGAIPKKPQLAPLRSK